MSKHIKSINVAYLSTLVNICALHSYCRGCPFRRPCRAFRRRPSNLRSLNIPMFGVMWTLNRKCINTRCYDCKFYNKEKLECGIFIQTSNMYYKGIDK